MTPEEKLEAGIKGAMSSPCLICGAAPKMAYVLPVDKSSDSVELNFYALCSTCSDRPDAEEASEKIVIARKSRPNPGLN